MWEKIVKANVEDSRREEGVDIADTEQVLAANANRCTASTSDGDVVNETRERRDAADEERSESAPVRRKFRRVSVDSVEVIP